MRNLLVEVPVPGPGLGGPSSPIVDQGTGLFPGGMQQRFRELKPIVADMVEGYGAEYLGVLESNSDGLGVWSADAFTLVTFVGNPTFHAFARLMAGDYGSRPLDPEHTMVLVNPYFTAPRDIGQPWDRRLREEADAIINGRQWDWIYCVRPCRGSRSEFGRPARRGVLALEYPGEWALWESDGGEGDQRGGYEVLADALVLAGGRDRPTDAEVVRALDGVPPASIIPPKPWRD